MVRQAGMGLVSFPCQDVAALAEASGTLLHELCTPEQGALLVEAASSPPPSSLCTRLLSLLLVSAALSAHKDTPRAACADKQ